MGRSCIIVIGWVCHFVVAVCFVVYAADFYTVATIAYFCCYYYSVCSNYWMSSLCHYYRFTMWLFSKISLALYNSHVSLKLLSIHRVVNRKVYMFHYFCH